MGQGVQDDLQGVGAYHFLLELLASERCAAVIRTARCKAGRAVRGRHVDGAATTEHKGGSVEHGMSKALVREDLAWCIALRRPRRCHAATLGVFVDCASAPHSSMS